MEAEHTCKSLRPWVFSEFLVGTTQVFSTALPACCFVTGWRGARVKAHLRLVLAPLRSSAFSCWLAGQGLTLWSTQGQGAAGQRNWGLGVPTPMGPGALEPLLPQWGRGGGFTSRKVPIVTSGLQAHLLVPEECKPL